MCINDTIEASYEQHKWQDLRDKVKYLVSLVDSVVWVCSHTPATQAEIEGLLEPRNLRLDWAIY